ncbi:MAG: hypothetical protein GX587_02550 [Bacteroidales bacterium]|nr:hypothetical protein [Bacteroidales bacterium]
MDKIIQNIIDQERERIKKFGFRCHESIFDYTVESINFSINSGNDSLVLLDAVYPPNLIETANLRNFIVMGSLTDFKRVELANIHMLKGFVGREQINGVLMPYMGSLAQTMLDPAEYTPIYLQFYKISPIY